MKLIANLLYESKIFNSDKKGNNVRYLIIAIMLVVTSVHGEAPETFNGIPLNSSYEVMKKFAESKYTLGKV